MCVCRKPEPEPELETTIVVPLDDVTKRPTASSDCHGNCATTAEKIERQQNDVSSDNRCEMEGVTCDDDCVVALDDNGCQFCLCDDIGDRTPASEPEVETEKEIKAMTTDRTTTTNHRCNKCFYVVFIFLHVFTLFDVCQRFFYF